MDNTRETFGYLWKQVAEVCLKVFSSDPSPMLGRGREPPPPIFQNAEEQKEAADTWKSGAEASEEAEEEEEREEC